MKATNLALAITLIALLVGCNEGGSDDDVVVIIDPPPPTLEAFHIVDSYGTSSEDSNAQLVLNPYLDNGFFEIYWYADNLDDYSIEIRINDRPTLTGSRFISSDYCGIDLECDREGIQFCEYYSDFSMSCDPPSTPNPNQYVTYFDDLINTVPQTMYLIVDLCDTLSNYCEYRVREVLLE